MSSYKRVRSNCKNEEANVSAFVDSCVDFVSNVTFHSADEGKTLKAAEGHVQTVLILGNEAQLKDYAAAAACPHYDAEVAAAAATAPTARAYVVRVTPTARVLIGKVPSEASRHNCASRPDMISSIVKQAVQECPAEDAAAGLDIYYLGAGYEVSAAGAIARACNQSFSAKNGLAEKSYLDAGRPVRVVIPSGKPAALNTLVQCVQLCQRLVDAPTNLLDTVTFTEIAVRWVDKLKKAGIDASVDIIAGEELREKGYGGLYGVGKAAEYPPHLVTVSYKPKAGISPQDKIAFVGKGIVYDSGGLSIKLGEHMCTMKHDMGGAAAIFCGLLTLALLGAPVQASSVLCIAENSVGPRSQRPDDIIRMKSGKSVEINNTDAEGRIVLSDGVAHACKELPYTPSIIIDMATLTGVQMMATGLLHASIYCNSDAAEKRVFKAGMESGDMCYPVLYCPELHTPEYPSKVADFRNSLVGRMPNASVSTAGRFVEMNLDKDYKGEWVHVDLAGPATRDEATGFGVALIAQLYAADQL